MLDLEKRIQLGTIVLGKGREGATNRATGKKELHRVKRIETMDTPMHVYLPPI